MIKDLRNNDHAFENHSCVVKFWKNIGLGAPLFYDLGDEYFFRGFSSHLNLEFRSKTFWILFDHGQLHQNIYINDAI